MKKIMVIVIGLLMASIGTGHATTLENWNVSQLNTAGDYISVSSWLINDTQTAVSFQWIENSTSDSTPTALGIDQIYYNISGSLGDGSTGFGKVAAVYENSISAPNDVTSDWNLNTGGNTGGGGFGNFVSKKNQEPGGTGGIAPDSLIFVLYGNVAFTPNSNNSTFDVHVRYGGNCSGWASDGSSSSVESDSNCGGTSVPEPSTLLLLGSGLVGLGFFGRRKA